MVNSHDPKVVPKKYYEVIDFCIQWCKDNYPDNYQEFFKAISNKCEASEINKIMDQHTQSKEEYKILASMVVTLSFCINGRLKEVCSTYDILQGHLGYAEENDVFNVISSYTLEEIKDNSPSADSASLTGEV